VRETPSQPKLLWWCVPVISAALEAEVGGQKSDINPQQKWETISRKITEGKKGWGCGSRAPVW
jgi:hypothetical protein